MTKQTAASKTASVGNSLASELKSAQGALELACQAEQERRNQMALMIWKVRTALPALVIQITPADREAFQQSLDYNEQKCKLNIEDRNGTTLIHLTDETTGDQIIATENNEKDLDKAQAAANLRQLKGAAPGLATALRSHLASGTMSDSLIQEACDTLTALAGA